MAAAHHFPHELVAKHVPGFHGGDHAVIEMEVRTQMAVDVTLTMASRGLRIEGSGRCPRGRMSRVPCQQTAFMHHRIGPDGGHGAPALRSLGA